MSDEARTPDIPTGPADVTWPRTALARLAFSTAAAELADHATAVVPTVNDDWGRSGDYVEQAAQLVAAAREVLSRAVVLERDRGASWSAIGEALDVSKQTVHERYTPILADWESGLNEPWSDDGPIRNPRLPEGAADPDAAAVRLDRWCAAHIEETTANRRHAEQAGMVARMVSAGLPQHTGTSEAASVVRQLRHLTQHGATPKQRAAFQTRKQAVLRDGDDHDVLAGILTAIGGGDDRVAADIEHRCRIARQHHDGHPSDAWSTGEQLAVALVLRDKQHLDTMGYTPQQAAQRVLDGMVDPPTDLTAWLEGIRTALRADPDENPA